jgi:hypothetical protein
MLGFLYHAPSCRRRHPTDLHEALLIALPACKPDDAFSQV